MAQSDDSVKFSDKNLTLTNFSTLKSSKYHFFLWMAYLKKHFNAINPEYTEKTLEESWTKITVFGTPDGKAKREKEEKLELIMVKEEKILSSNIVMDINTDFGQQYKHLGENNELIQLLQGFNRKFIALFKSKTKTYLIEKILAWMSILDVLFEDLQNYQVVPMDVPTDYSYQNVRGLVKIVEGYEVYQVIVIENFLVNIKRALITLLHYYLISIRKSANWYGSKMLNDEYDKNWTRFDWKTIKSYLLSKSCQAYIHLKGKDIFQTYPEPEGQNLTLESLSYSNETQILADSNKISSLLSYFQILKSIPKSDLFFCLLFQSPSPSPSCSSFFDSLDTKMLKEDPNSVLTNSFHQVLKLSKAFLCQSKDFLTLQYIEEMVYGKMRKWVENISQMLHRDLKDRNIKSRDLAKRFKAYVLRLNMWQGLIGAYNWVYEESGVEEVQVRVFELRREIFDSKKNLKTKGLVREWDLVDLEEA